MPKDQKDPNIEIRTVYECPRCGGKLHMDLRFRRFRIPPADPSDGIPWLLWAICPDSGDPILMKVIVPGSD